MEEIFYKYGLTAIWSFMMLVWFFQALPKFKNYVKENSFGDYEQPRTAATLGVLGTFIGIVIGLFLFDANNIQGSIEKLLGGMETAFATSIIGMIMSLYFKNFQFNAQKNSKTIINSDANISDLIQYLQKSDAEKNNFLKALNDSLVGDGEYTVVGQIKMIRFDINEKFKSVENIFQENNQQMLESFKNFDKNLAEKFKSVENILQENNQQMLNAFENFAEKLAENNSKIFIEALNETMKDFNQKLSEQFGENFKQLNVAVGRLLEWQENYKQTVENTTKILQLTFKGIESAKNSIAEIEKSVATFKESSDRILKLLVTANLYEQKLSQVLKEIQSLGANAGTEFKNLAEQINNVMLETKDLTQQMNEQGNQALLKLVDVTEATVNSMEQILQTSCDEVQNYTEQATQDLNLHINSATENLNEKIIDTTENVTEMTKQIIFAGNKTLSEISEVANENSTLFKKVLNQFGTEIQNYTEQAAQDVNLHINSTTDNLNEKLQATLIQTNNMTTTVNDFGNTVLKKISKTAEQNISSLDELSKNVISTSKKQREIMDAEVQATKNSVEKSAAAPRDDTFKITKKVSDALEMMMKNNNENLKTATDNLNKNLLETLNKSVEEFGHTMYLVSQKFVDDYTPLTEKLSKLVKIAENVGRR